MERKLTKKEYDINYAKTKLKRVPLDLKKEFYEDVALIAKSCGMSVNGFIKEAINEKIQRMN